MILTNRLGLPKSIENAVRNDGYSKGSAHISVTALVGPARKRAIEIEHSDEITEDVAERIWALMGQVTHGILQRADDENNDVITEKRLYVERHGWWISGQFDRYLVEPDGLVQDYKLTSTYTIKDGRKVEWEQQQNLYALLLRENGYKVNKLEVVAILRDWQRSKAKHTKDYPQVPVAIIPIEMWPPGKVEAFVTDRLIAHGRAQFALPECTPEERWERPAKFALHKDSSSRALSLHDTIEAADIALRERIMTQNHGKREMFYVQERPAEQRRCENYCAAYSFCAQGQKLVSMSDPVASLRRK